MHTGKAKLDTVAPDARGVGRCGCRGSSPSPAAALATAVLDPTACCRRDLSCRAPRRFDSIPPPRATPPPPRSIINAACSSRGAPMFACSRPRSRTSRGSGSRGDLAVGGRPGASAVRGRHSLLSGSPARRSPQAAQAYPARANARKRPRVRSPRRP